MLGELLECLKSTVKSNLKTPSVVVRNLWNDLKIRGQLTFFFPCFSHIFTNVLAIELLILIDYCILKKKLFDMISLGSLFDIIKTCI